MSVTAKKKLFSDSCKEFELPKINLSGKDIDTGGRIISFRIKATEMKKFSVSTPKKSNGIRSKGMKFELDFTPKKEKPPITTSSSSDEDLGKSSDPTSLDNLSSLSKRKKTNTNLAINLNFALNVDGSPDSGLSSSPSPSGENLNDHHQLKNTPQMDTPQEIKVAVRMRPLSENEKSTQGKNINHIIMKEQKVLVVPKNDLFDCNYCLDSSDPEKFNFASQEIVYRRMGHPLLEFAFQGYNTCLFAYGQSGSGKTYTMIGTEENPGIIPRFINELFRRIQTSRDVVFTAHISFMEIYQEKIYDLLTDDFESFGKNLRVREHPETGPYVEDLSMFTVDSAENALELLRNGLNRRSIASTSSNEKSNRSHTIFSIILVQKKKPEIDNCGDYEVSCVSKINLIDLAGSERINSSTVERFRESGAINKSLLTLGKVINQLAENTLNPKNVQHVPYRDSVLTYLLKESLGGNSRTSMIATISPAMAHLDETMSTLRYAATAKKIINIVHVNEDPREQVIHHLKRQISHLKRQVEDKSIQSNGDSSPENQTVVFNGKKHGECCETVLKQLSDLKKLKTIVLKQQKLCNDLKCFEAQNTAAMAFCNENVEPYEHKIVDKIKAAMAALDRIDVVQDLPDFRRELKRSITVSKEDSKISETEVKKLGTWADTETIKKFKDSEMPKKIEKESGKMKKDVEKLNKEPESKKIEKEPEPTKIDEKEPEPTKIEKEPEPEKIEEEPEPEKIDEKSEEGKMTERELEPEKIEKEKEENLPKAEPVVESKDDQNLQDDPGDNIGDDNTKEEKKDDDVVEKDETDLTLKNPEKDSFKKLEPKEKVSQGKGNNSGKNDNWKPATKGNSKKDRRAKKKRGFDDDEEDSVPDWTKGNDSNNDYEDAKDKLSESFSTADNPTDDDKKEEKTDDPGKPDKDDDDNGNGNKDKEDGDDDSGGDFKPTKKLTKKQLKKLEREKKKGK